MMLSVQSVPLCNKATEIIPWGTNILETKALCSFSNYATLTKLYLHC
jgi:hypothetical protein